MINWYEPIEVKYSGVWSDAKIEYMGQQLILVSSRGIEYACEKDSSLIWVRNKQKEPEEKWRPFRDDELDYLFLQTIRAKDSDDKCVITRICGVAIQFGARWYSSNELFGLCELKQDGKWGPCGVKES